MQDGKSTDSESIRRKFAWVLRLKSLSLLTTWSERNSNNLIKRAKYAGWVVSAWGLKGIVDGIFGGGFEIERPPTARSCCLCLITFYCVLRNTQGLSYRGIITSKHQWVSEIANQSQQLIFTILEYFAILKFRAQSISSCFLSDVLYLLDRESSLRCFRCRKVCAGESLLVNDQLFHADCLVCLGK